MAYLVTYYSRTGNNRTIAEAIAKSLSADIDEITENKKRTGKLGYIKAGADSKSGKLAEIEFEKDPQNYDTIIIGAPIWAGNPIPPLRTYLQEVELKGKRVAFFICSQTSGYTEMFPKLVALIPDSEHIGNFGITQKRFKEEDYSTELEAFVAKIK